MISRIWHGYTETNNADPYEALLHDEIITGIEDRSIDGFREYEVFRPRVRRRSGVITVMWFDSFGSGPSLRRR